MLAAFSLSSQLGFVAIASSPVATAAPVHHAAQAIRTACAPPADCAGRRNVNETLHLSLPGGLSECPASGPYAACAAGDATGDSTPGASGAPLGLTPCAAIATKPLPTTPAACDNTLLPVDTTSDRGGRGPAAAGGPLVVPSVPLASLSAETPRRVQLAADSTTLTAGQNVVLTATASGTVTGTASAIEIFDAGAQTLVGACAQGSRCSVAYSAKGGQHTFVAFITPPDTAMPPQSSSVASNQVSVGWLDSSISASALVLAPGQGVKLTATSTIDVRPTGRWLEIYDLTAQSRVTFCSQGRACTTTMKSTVGGVHELVAYVNGRPESVSTPVYVTWLSVKLSATTVGSGSGSAVYLKAVANADLTTTPWVIGIYDQQGRLVDHACKTGDTCSVQAWVEGKQKPSYTAIIGQLPHDPTSIVGGLTKTVTAQPPLVNIQAKSGAVQPDHLLWGVDSCKAFDGLYWSVVSKLGTPEFWGRYLTDTVCPGISSAEVALARTEHMGILPIYNDYDCSNVSYYDTGARYAAAAVAAAQNLGIPTGRVLAIDIEPAGAECPGAANVDSGFIDGWFDGVFRAGYVPVYYGNGTGGSEFASAWCTAVSVVPAIARNSYLWSFEPSLLGDFNKTNAPGFGPYNTGCSGSTAVWQYTLSAGNTPDVDHDEALSSLPLWYP